MSSNLAGLDRAFDSVYGQLDSANQRIATLTQELKDARKRIAELEQEAGKTTKTIEAKDKRIAELEQRTVGDVLRIPANARVYALTVTGTMIVLTILASILTH